MNHQVIEFELLDCMKSLNDNQKDDVLNFVKKISGSYIDHGQIRKNALREIRAALKRNRF
jgi:uncharacterized protein YpuA (DUF1002 family)